MQIHKICKYSLLSPTIWGGVGGAKHPTSPIYPTTPVSAFEGPIILVWDPDRIRLCKKARRYLPGSGKPLPWPFGPHIAVYKYKITHTPAEAG